MYPVYIFCAHPELDEGSGPSVRRNLSFNFKDNSKKDEYENYHCVSNNP
jgi:hypothetical protein